MSLLPRSVLLLLLLLSSVNTQAFDQFEAFKKNGKYGLRNADTEEVVLKAEYEAVGWSNNSFEVINSTIGILQNEKWALASVEDGHKITQHLYTALYPFTDHLFVAGVRSDFSILSTFGVISTKGKVTIDLKYDRLVTLGDQLIAGKLTKGQYQFGLLSKNGRQTIPEQYQSIEAIEKGILSVKNNKALSAIYTTEGDQLSDFEFEDIRPHDDQYLLVTYYNHQALIDKTGKTITPPIYKEIKLDTDGKTKGLAFKKWSLFGNSTNPTKPLYFDRAMPIDQYTLAIEANGNVGVITPDQRYKSYLPGLRLLGTYYGLLLVANDQYQGVVDTKGNFVLPLNYDSIEIKERMIFGQIKRRDKQDWQVYSHRGIRQSKEKYESYKQATDYITYAKRNGKSGILDGRGNESSPFFYDAIYQLKGNKMVVAYQGNQGIINDRGNWIITPYRDSLKLFEDYAIYKRGSEWGILDFLERTLYKSQKPLTPISEKLLVTKDEDGYQLINFRGSLLQQNHYDSIYRIDKDLIALKKGDKFELFKPSNFKIQKAPVNTESLSHRTEGMIATKIDGQWGFISDQAQLMIANRYDSVDRFSEGLAAVKLIGKWGVIDNQEGIVIQPTYDRIEPFAQGLAVVEQNGLLGLIDKKGKLILDLKYTDIQRFERYIILKAGTLSGLADTRGSIIRSPQYDSIKAIGNEQFIVSSRSKFGVISLSGVDQVAVAFEQIQIFGNLLLASEPSEWKTLSIK